MVLPETRHISVGLYIKSNIAQRGARMSHKKQPLAFSQRVFFIYFVYFLET